MIKAWFWVGFILGVLSSCTPTSSAPDAASKLLNLDARDLFIGNWCWVDTVACGVNSSISNTTVNVTKTSVANEVTLLGLTGVVSGSNITVSFNKDSFGGTWSGRIERKGKLLSINLSVFNTGSGLVCTHKGNASLEGCKDRTDGKAMD
ncbi:MAG: hypothetical protein JST48_08570 [Bacteroidetes bacterium]|nr:hypothetical protein [Bacteroidota bacterium]